MHLIIKKGWRKITAKWVWADDASHYLVNERNSYAWVEMNRDNKLFEFEFIVFEGADPVIFDQKRSLYAKIGKDKIVFAFHNIENLNESKTFASGYWLMKPNQSRVQLRIKGNLTPQSSSKFFK